MGGDDDAWVEVFSTAVRAVWELLSARDAVVRALFEYDPDAIGRLQRAGYRVVRPRHIEVGPITVSAGDMSASAAAINPVDAINLVRACLAADQSGALLTLAIDFIECGGSATSGPNHPVGTLRLRMPPDLFDVLAEADRGASLCAGIEDALLTKGRQLGLDVRVTLH